VFADQEQIWLSRMDCQRTAQKHSQYVPGTVEVNLCIAGTVMPLFGPHVNVCFCGCFGRVS